MLFKERGACCCADAESNETRAGGSSCCDAWAGCINKLDLSFGCRRSTRGQRSRRKQKTKSQSPIHAFLKIDLMMMRVFKAAQAQTTTLQNGSAENFSASRVNANFSQCNGFPFHHLKLLKVFLEEHLDSPFLF